MKNVTPQFDTTIRLVSMENLDAMVRRLSDRFGMRYEITTVGSARVGVTAHSADCDDAGNETHYSVTAFFKTMMYAGNIGVLIGDIQTIYRGERSAADSEDWQLFTPLMDCPKLWRNPKNGVWMTEEEINAKPFDLASLRRTIEIIRMTRQSEVPADSEEYWRLFRIEDYICNQCYEVKAETGEK